jgi:hypothetical protein
MNSKKFLATLILLLVLTPLAAQHHSSRMRVSILGDSYSTYEGYIPTGNAIWYWAKTDTANTDVSSVRQTWWWQLISRGGYLLEKNESFSGATISYRGYRGEDYTDRSFITRLPRLGSPDILFIFGGTNDSWAGVPVGEPQSGDLFTYSPALDRLLADAKDRYPNVQIYFLLNDGLREDITRATITSCEAHQIPCIQLHDIHKKSGHPSVAGMQSIAEQVLSFISSPTVGSFPSEK